MKKIQVWKKQVGNPSHQIKMFVEMNFALNCNRRRFGGADLNYPLWRRIVRAEMNCFRESQLRLDYQFLSQSDKSLLGTNRMICNEEERKQEKNKIR